MRGKLISTTNNKFENLVGQETDIEIDLSAYFLGLQTSRLLSVDFKHGSSKTVVVINTKNSTYIFEVNDV